uniref:C2H2-type domain-containing protein n=1 Tax=Ditylenchus dipsaci TaxID=166011 RepID=A0A915D813_9BILA
MLLFGRIPPTNINEFQEAVIMLLWTELGVSPQTMFGLRLEDLKFHRLSDGSHSFQVECEENSTKRAYEVTQKRSKYSTFDWLLMYLRMRRVLDPDNLGTDKICIKVEYNQQPLFLAEEKHWLVGMTPFNPNSNFMRKVARQMGLTEGSLTWNSFKKGMAKKIFRSLLHTHNSGDLTWREVEETLILKGLWKNTSEGEGTYSSLGHTLYKRQFQKWKSGGNWSVDKCVPYLHELALPNAQFVRPTDKIVEVIGEHLEKHWVEESKAHLASLVNYMKGLDTKNLTLSNNAELEAAREVLLKEKDAQQAFVLYNKCKCADLLNQAKAAVHNHFGLGKKINECKDMKLSLEGMQTVNPCFLYDLLPLRSPFRDFDMHFWRGNESLQCFVASCSASFTDVLTFQMHLKQQHLEKDLPLRVVCECANFTTTILEATTIGGGRNPFEELNDHIRCTHHTNTYCTATTTARERDSNVISDDSAPSPVKQARIAKGGKLNDQPPPQESMSEELGRGADLISSCKYSPVKVEEKEVMHSTAAKDAGKKNVSALRALPKAPTDIMADDTKQCLENGHLFKWPYSVLVVFEKVDSRCGECVSVACNKFCVADLEWKALITDQLKSNRGSLTVDAFTTKMMCLLDSSRKWEHMDEVPSCAKK